jgi:hypothetical protein
MAITDLALINQIQRHAAIASNDEVFRAIGNSLSPAERSQVAEAASLRPSDLVEIGKRFYDKELRPLIDDAICTKLKFCENRKKYDAATEVISLIIQAVGEAISKTHGIPEEAGKLGGKVFIEVSAAVVKEGLNSLCRCN